MDHSYAFLSDSSRPLSGLQPRIIRAFVESATRRAGSPPLLPANSTGSGLPTASLALETMSRTLRPLEVPMLNASVLPPLARYSSARALARATSSTST